MAGPGIITLTTDFGLRDANVAAMKGVILSLNPQARIIDLSHEVSPQNVSEGAYILARGFSYFPSSTVHLAVVDPGVGSERRTIAASVLGFCFVAPDNGILTYILHLAGRSQSPVTIVNLTDPRLWRPRVSPTFHGRDIFAPVAAHLSLGLDIRSMGEPITDPVMIPVPEMKKEPGRITGHVLYIDRFGNLLTDIPQQDVFSLGQSIMVKLADVEIRGLSATFSSSRRGGIIAYIDSGGHLAVAQVEGSVARTLRTKIGDAVEVTAV